MCKGPILWRDELGTRIHERVSHVRLWQECKSVMDALTSSSPFCSSIQPALPVSLMNNT